MLPLQHSGLWRTASLMLLLLVLVSALMPVVWFWNDKVRALSLFQGADKWLHAITFLVLAAWFAGQYRPASYWRIAVGLMGFGLLIEVCQLMVGYRTADWYDLSANAAGIVTGLAAATAGLGGWCLRVEHWYSARDPGKGID